MVFIRCWRGDDVLAGRSNGGCVSVLFLYERRGALSRLFQARVGGFTGGFGLAVRQRGICRSARSAALFLRDRPLPRRRGNDQEVVYSPTRRFRNCPQSKS